MLGSIPINPTSTPATRAIIPLTQYLLEMNITHVIANIRKLNISAVPKYKTIFVYHGRNKNTNKPQIKPLIQLVLIAALNALAASPRCDIGNPSIIVAAAPPAPGIFITTPQKLSPMLLETTIAVVNTTSI